MLMTTVQWTSEHARQEEGPFRLKGVGGWDLFSSFFFQTGGVVLLFANKCVFCFSVDAVFMIRFFFFFTSFKLSCFRCPCLCQDEGS